MLFSQSVLSVSFAFVFDDSLSVSFLLSAANRLFLFDSCLLSLCSFLLSRFRLNNCFLRPSMFVNCCKKPKKKASLFTISFFELSPKLDGPAIDTGACRYLKYLKDDLNVFIANC